MTLVLAMRAHRPVPCRAAAAGYLSLGHGPYASDMTTTVAEPDLKPCKCGCGTLVKGNYAKGHWAKAQKANRQVTPLPAPDDDLGEDEIPADLQAEIDALDAADREQEEGEPEEVTPDKPPGRLREPRSRTPTTSAKRVRLTAAVRKDVEAKIRFVLVPAGQVWQARDPWCGGAFSQQEPEVSSALAEIVCDSPDLLAWFSGPAGGFMKYFRLFMALQPVAMTVWMHHLRHVELPADAQQPPQMPAYAA